MTLERFLACLGVEEKTPFANSLDDGSRLYRFEFAYRSSVLVFACHDEDAFEVAVEWLDDHAPGILVSHSEFESLCKEAAEELGVSVLDDAGDIREGVLAMAERDLTVIGHATLKTGGYIASADWSFEELTP